MYFKNYTQKPLFLYLPQYDELFPEGSVQRVIDRFVDRLDLSDVEATYMEGGAPPFHPSVLLKVVLYAYTRNIYACRPIADMCRTDMICRWFLNFEDISFSTINRFRSEHMGKERTAGVLEQLLRILVEDGLICFEQCMYVDGTTIESRASRTRIEWVQNVRRFAEANVEKIQEIINAVTEQADRDSRECAGDAPDTDGSQIPDGKQSDAAGDTAADASGTETTPTPEPDGDGDGDGPKKKTKKRTRSVHMSGEEVERIRQKLKAGEMNLDRDREKELRDRLDRADRYREKDEMFGDKSGQPTTDPDSVAMHPKDDVRHTGPCLAMYNTQIMSQNQFIIWAGIYGWPSDMAVFPDFLESIPRQCTPKTMAADAGYGSALNCTLAGRRGIVPYFKYSMYDRECSKNFTPDPYNVEYMPELPDGSLKCPGGEMKKIREETEYRDGVGTTTCFYRTDQCAQCRFREKCLAKKQRQDFREAKRKKEWQQTKPDLKERLDSTLGQALLSNRTKDVEPCFSHLKWAGAYRRFRHFDSEMCGMDLLLRVIAHNLKKYVSIVFDEDDTRRKKYRRASSTSKNHTYTCPYRVYGAIWGRLAAIFAGSTDFWRPTRIAS